jgi:hypothetical protein
MKKLSFLNKIIQKRTDAKAAGKELIASFWEDDYCQVEIVPGDNRTFIEEQIEKIEKFTKTADTGLGFTDALVRAGMLFPTDKIELRTESFESLLAAANLKKADRIKMDGQHFLPRESPTRAFGIPGFFIFFYAEGEFIKDIWLTPGFIADTAWFDMLLTALIKLGEDFSFILVDWNSLELIDLKNKKDIRKYLAGFVR